MAKRKSTASSDRDTRSAFVSLPIRHGDVLRVLGPNPDEAAVAVEPLVKLDEPLTVVQSVVAGLCDADGRLMQPVELTILVDPTTVVPNKQVPTAALLKLFAALPELQAKLSTPTGFEVLGDAIGRTLRLGPLLYCRKRQCIFAARSPRTGELLQAVPGDRITDVRGADGSELPAELLSWDGSAEDTAAAPSPARGKKPAKRVRPPVFYGGGGGTSTNGRIASLEQLMLDQGKVVALAAKVGKKDPRAGERLTREHACVECPECERCYPAGDGYAYAADRLVAISAAEAPLVFSPLGEWRLDEASRVVGGLLPSECVALREREDNDFETWLGEQAQRVESFGPARLLAGESDGRELLEVARLKLGLIAGVLEQLDAAWQATGRPHLCWNPESVRVAWRRPVATPAMCWGFQPLLRKAGMQPNSALETLDGGPLPYPPAFSDPAYLPPLAVDATRYFDEPRRATVFVKKSQTGDGTGVDLLLEDLGIPWELFCTSDTLHLAGEGWHATLAPAPQRDPNDGEGLPFSGRVTGNTPSLNKGQQIDGVECRWYPRFNEAVDLHAIGMLLFEALLSHDERSVQSFREQMAAEIAELTKSCRALPIEQRDEHARGWVTERCEADAPAAVWTRRNLLYRRDDRNATRLDAFNATLWQEIMTFGLRLTTSIAGFSFCTDRGCAAPRLAGDLLLPLVELRGLMALLDDQILGRTAPGAAVREAFKE